MVHLTHRSHRPTLRRTDARAANSTEPSNSADTRAVLLGRFSDAISIVSVVHESLAAQEIRGTGDEEVALRIGLDLLRSAYEELDAASSGHDSSP